jgi:hypothetical protein
MKAYTILLRKFYARFSEHTSPSEYVHLSRRETATVACDKAMALFTISPNQGGSSELQII